MKFHPKEAIENPNILDEMFTEMEKEFKKRNVPMSEEQTRPMITIMMSDEERIDGMFIDFSKLFPFDDFYNRCTIFSIKYEKKLLLWLSLMTMDFGIGGMILIGYYVQWWINKNRDRHYILLKNEIEDKLLTLNTVVELIFPFGVFSKELVHEFWDKQKVQAKSDNLIDHAKCSESFFLKE